MKWSAPGACKPEEGWYGQSKYCYEKVIHVVTIKLACSKRSISGERCEVKKAMKSRGGLTSPPPRFYFLRSLATIKFAVVFGLLVSSAPKRMFNKTIYEEQVPCCSCSFFPVRIRPQLLISPSPGVCI